MPWQTVSRNDDRMLRLRMSLKLEGFAVYHMLAEKIAESDDGSCTADYQMLAFDFRTDQETVRAVAEDYSLFLKEGDKLSLADAPEEAASCQLSRKRAMAGRKGMQRRWAMRKQNDDTAATDNKSTTAPEDNNSAAAAPGDNNNATADNKTITKPAEKKETENIPLHPLKEKDKENATEKREESPSADDNSEQRLDNFCRSFCDYWNKAIEVYNSRLRPIRLIQGQRRERLASLRGKYSDREISRFVKQAATSPYLNARDGRLSQPADLNWLLATDDRIVKVIEGNL